MATVLPVGRGDYAALARFNAEFPGDGHDVAFWERRFHLWWDANPAFDESVPRGWVLCDEDKANRIVGFLGNVPTRFRIAGRDQRVSNATTWRVHPDQRSGSIPLYLAQIEAAAGGLMFNTTPNADVRKVLEYLHFTSLPSYPSGRTHLVPLRFRRVAAAYLGARDDIPARVKPLGALALATLTVPAQVTLRLSSSRRVTTMARANSSFDRLWERTRDRHVATSVRGAKEVDWLCFSNPDFRRTLIGCTDGDALRGYAIFGDATWRGLRVLETIDLWTEPGGDVAAALVAGAWRHARHRGYDVLALHDFSPDQARLFRRLGVVLTTPNDRRHFFGAGDDDPPPLAGSYLTALEGDLAV